MLEVINIHKVYSNGAKAVPVLKGVHVRVTQGAFIAIVGPSGAGKSTLLHILGGLDVPSQGKVLFEGEDMYRLDDGLLSQIRNKKIGFVFQFYHLLSEFTVLENVLMPALINPDRSKGRAQMKQEALSLLTQMGLSERITHFPNQLSGGERQRVAIARALINNPSLLLCDEPTGNLDSKTGAEIIALVKKINTQSHMSIVLVTHNQELAAVADTTYHLQDGVLVH